MEKEKPRKTRKNISVKDLMTLMKPVMKTGDKLLLLLVQETKKTGMIKEDDFMDLAVEEMEKHFSTEDSLTNSIRGYMKQFVAKGFIEIEGDTIKIRNIPPEFRAIESGEIVNMNILIAGLAIWLILFFVALISMDWRLILLTAIGLSLTAITYFTYQRKYVLPR